MLPTETAGDSDHLSAAAVVQQARDMNAFVDSQSSRAESTGELTSETVTRLREDGLFSLMVPKNLGGAEASPSEAIAAIEALSAADGSTGWVVLACGVAINGASAYLEPAVAQQLFGKNRPIIAGQGAPNGKAIVEKDGFRLSGRWNYGSGIRHADRVHAGAMIIKDGAPRLLPNGQPEHRMFVVPRNAAWLDPSWDVMGLRATGSVDYGIDGIFVPEELTYHATAQQPRSGGAFLSVGIPGFAVMGHTAFALGIASRAISEITTLCQTGAGSRHNTLENSESFMQGLATAESQYRAARAFAADVWGDAERAMSAGDLLTTRQATHTRLALLHATEAAISVTNFAYRAAGGRSLRSSPLQRCFRDMMSGAQHIQVSPGVLRDCGRVLAGFAENKKWAAFNLVDLD
jgi:indole-3-acetate monooxygenase